MVVAASSKRKGKRCPHVVEPRMYNCCWKICGATANADLQIPTRKKCVALDRNPILKVVVCILLAAAQLSVQLSLMDLVELNRAKKSHQTIQLSLTKSAAVPTELHFSPGYSRWTMACDTDLCLVQCPFLYLYIWLVWTDPHCWIRHLETLLMRILRENDCH